MPALPCQAGFFDSIASVEIHANNVGAVRALAQKRREPV